MKRNRSTVHWLIVLCELSLVLPWCIPASAQRTSRRPSVLTNSVANDPIAFDISPPLRLLPVQAMALEGTRLMHPPLRPKLQQLNAAAAAQSKAPARNAAPSTPGPLISAGIGLSFDGISGDPGSAASENCPLVSGVQLAPPDTNMAVGDTQVVQWVNICYSVYNKATGALIAGPFPGSHFWAGFSNSVCSFRNDGDIIIQWDKVNHVWMAAQNVIGPYLTCVAVSTSADAMGSYNRYQFVQPGFPDYPKWGLTPDLYYQTQNDLGANDGFKGVNVCAYDAVAMRAGKKAKQVCILDNSNGTLFDDNMLPADNDSTGGATSSEVLLGSIDNFLPGDTHVYQYVFTVNLKKGTATLAGVNGSMPISVPGFNLALCSPSGFLTTACVPQPSPGSELLDTLGDRLMYRLARSVDSGGTQHFLVTHSVDNTSAVAARWYEFTAPSGSTSLSLAQSGDTPDDGEYRWMGSIARDTNGDIALGYSRSSAATGDYPSIYVSGQTAGEPAGSTDAESLIWQGGGSQLNTGNRWGDYSSMALDSAGCTFWYATEYYPFDGSFQWYTHIASLKFPNCH